tara:strand:- start:239 stop:406 length:168 start_codon:yes stop_codon:yes gene_type:complete
MILLLFLTLPSIIFIFFYFRRKIKEIVNNEVDLFIEEAKIPKQFRGLIRVKIKWK